MKRRGRSRVRMHPVALLALGAGVFAVAGAGPSSAQVSTVVGSASGVFSDVSLFNGCLPPQGCVRAPVPTVTLPEGGSSSPVTATAPSASIVYGPATLFSSGRLDVSTEGTTGPTGSVTSSVDIANVNTSGNEIFTADSLTSTCTASEGQKSGSATVTGGSVILQDPDSDATGEPGEVVQAVPANPAPNTEFSGTTAPPVNDNFRIVFNEQIANPDGSITVNAVHEYLEGPTAVGDVIIGESVCGVNPTAVTTTTAADGQAPTTIRVGELVRTGSESDLMIAFAAMALTIGALLVMGAKGLPGQDDPPPAEPDGARQPPPG